MEHNGFIIAELKDSNNNVIEYSVIINGSIKIFPSLQSAKKAIDSHIIEEDKIQEQKSPIRRRM